MPGSHSSLPSAGLGGVPFQAVPVDATLAATLDPSREIDVPAGGIDQSLLDGLPWPAVLLDRTARIALANRAWWRRMVPCSPGGSSAAAAAR